MGCRMEQGPRRVVRTPGVCGGSPCIEGTRLTCANVALRLSETQADLDGYLRLYPFLSRHDVLDCLAYCARQLCLVDNEARYCQRCSLDLSPPSAPPAAYLESLDDLRGSEELASSGQMFPGSPAEYERDITPLDIWKVSQDLLRQLPTA